jgi:parvulin-like peptidyl-prolyl isomerase
MDAIPYAVKYDLPDVTGGMTLGIYSETITADEILGFAEQTLRPYAEKTDRATFEVEAKPFVRETVKGKVTEILLYQEARKSAPANIDETIDKAVESEVARFVAGYDNNYALAERAIKQMGMNWKTFRDYQKKLILTQSYISSALKEEKRFSFRELQDYYESIKDEQYTTIGSATFSLIDLIPANLTADQIEDGETPQAAAERIAENLIARIAGGADFAELARQYSHGPFARLGGQLQPVTLGTNSLAEPYATLEKEAIRMQPGQTKGPILIDGRVFILKLNDLQHANVKTFPEVQKQIEQQMLFRHRQKQYEELVQKLILKTDLVQLERFTEFCTRQAYDRWGRDR